MSPFLKLGQRDFLNGMYIAVSVVVFGALQQMTMAHGLDFAAYDWKTILTIALGAIGAYLQKNLFTDSDGKIFGKI